MLLYSDIKTMFNKGDLVVTPFGTGNIFDIWHVGDSPPLYDDSGKILDQTCYAVRIKQESWCWFKESDLKEVE